MLTMAAFTLRCHAGNKSPAHSDAAHQVDFETSRPLFVGKVLEGPCVPHSEVVNQDVGSPPKSPEDVRHCVIGARGRSEVGGHRAGPALGLFLQDSFVFIANDDARALSRQQIGRCFADAIGSGIDIRKFSPDLTIHYFPPAFGSAKA